MPGRFDRTAYMIRPTDTQGGGSLPPAGQEKIGCGNGGDGGLTESELYRELGALTKDRGAWEANIPYVASLLASASVGVAGLLGFVGLIAPHCVRAVIGSDHRLLLPGSALAGALLTVGSDFAGRMISPPLELPAGLVMALLGPLFFLGLLLRSGVWSDGR